MTETHPKTKLEKFWSGVILLFFIFTVTSLIGWVGDNPKVLDTIWIFGGEREGTVKYNDCREVTETEDNFINRIFRTYTCSYQKTNTGKIMSGECVYVKSPLFSGDCVRAYTYTKKPEVRCSEVFPYLGYDEKCYMSWDYGRVYTAIDKTME